MFGKRFFEMRHLRDSSNFFFEIERNYFNSQLNILEIESFSMSYRPISFGLPLYQYIFIFL